MIAMSPTTFFLIGLLLKIAMTAGIVVAASVVVERSGPFIGALIASLPTAGGAALIILAVEHPPAFIAASVIGSMVSVAISAVFALTYAALAQRRSIATSLVGAFVVWFVPVFLSRFMPWTALSASWLVVIVFPVTIYLGRGFRDEGKAKAKVEVTHRDLAWRAGVVTVCVILVTAASTAIGPYLSGVFAFFPVAMSSFFIILHSRVGGKAAASVAAHLQAPLIGLAPGFLAVHYLAVPLGVWWSYLIGLAICVAWNAVLWLARRRGLKQ
jgi:uncharacterized membrane protein (GlpM family)